MDQGRRIDLTQWQTKPADLLKIGATKVTPYRYINRAFALLNMGLDQKAAREAVEALRMDSHNAKAHKILGMISNNNGNYDAAFESLRKAKLKNPNDMETRYQIARALFHLGKIEKAKQQCEMVIEQDPKNSEALTLLSLINAQIRE